VLTHRLNDVLRILTVLTVVFLPLTLISGIWGMNVGIPGQGSKTAFWIVIGSMLALAVGMIAFFRRRGWL
jgi:magnesium transporter